MADAGGGDRGPIADGHPGRLRDAIGRLPHHFVNAARPGPTLPTGPGRALTGACSDSPPPDPPERPSRSGALHVYAPRMAAQVVELHRRNSIRLDPPHEAATIVIGLSPLPHILTRPYRNGSAP